MPALNHLVSEAVDVVVHCRRSKNGPQVVEVACVEDMIGPADSTNFTLTGVFGRDHDGDMSWTGVVPARLAAALGDVGLDVRTFLNGCAATSS